MRPRKVLIASCPWLSTSEASDALRDAGGDVEKAKRVVLESRRGGSQQTQKKKSNDGNKLKNDDEDLNKKRPPSPPKRAPPRHAVSINNLSDRQYCCVWSVEVFEDGYRPDVARTLLANVARHVNPILRDRGWRVKRLIESASSSWIGLCTANGRQDADAASTNIQLNLRVLPDKHCKQFRSFHQILAVMLHEITHTSIGLEDIHPPAFWELLEEIKKEYKTKLQAGEVELETDDYGSNGRFVSSSGKVDNIANSASDILGTSGSNNLSWDSGTEGDCGASKKKKRSGRKWKKRSSNKYSAGYTSNVQKEKKRPLLKGAKMIDKRTKVGKAAIAATENLSARELAARAALARFGSASSANASSSASTTAAAAAANESEDETNSYSNNKKGDDISSSSDGEDGDDSVDEIKEHNNICGCRACNWTKMFNLD